MRQAIIGIPGVLANKRLAIRRAGDGEITPLCRITLKVGRNIRTVKYAPGPLYPIRAANLLVRRLASYLVMWLILRPPRPWP